MYVSPRCYRRSSPHSLSNPSIPFNRPSTSLSTSISPSPPLHVIQKTGHALSSITGQVHAHLQTTELGHQVVTVSKGIYRVASFVKVGNDIMQKRLLRVQKIKTERREANRGVVVIARNDYLRVPSRYAERVGDDYVQVPKKNETR